MNRTRMRHGRGRLLAVLLTVSLAVVALPAAGAAQESPADGAFVSDWFDGDGLDTSVWSVTDPKGDGSVSVAGGVLSLAVPAGETHNLWAGQDHALRVLQPAADVDFEAEARFVSVPSTGHQMQGLLVRQDAANWSRFEVHHDGSGLVAYAARTINGKTRTQFSAPLQLTGEVWLRLAREGSSWTLAASGDGSSWSTVGSFSHDLQLTELGPFAGNYHGNASQAPAFTAQVEHVVEVGGGDPDPDPEPDEFTVDVQVSGSGTVDLDPEQATYTDGQQVTLTATPADGWEFTGWGGDLTGTTNPATLTVDADKTVTATFDEQQPDPDPDPEPDPPTISGVGFDAGSRTLTWTTDAPADARVDYGITSSYGAVATAAGPATAHAVELRWLACERQYQFQVTSANEAGSDSATGTFVTATCPNPGEGEPPAIDLWHGTQQAVTSKSQQWVNVLGTVASAHGVASLTYSVNGGPDHPLSMGPTPRRLAAPGDFNAEVDYDELEPGANEVVVTATDVDGRVSTATVTLEVTGAGETLPLPFTTDWAGAASVHEYGRPVDGRWVLDGDTLRLDALDYDRMFTLGDVGWSDYEVTVPVTVMEFGPHAYVAQSGAPMVGLAVRWPGHSQAGSEQPRSHWYPNGAFAWYRWQQHRFELVGNDGTPFDRHSGLSIELGTTYVLKVRAQTTSSGTEYRFKVWPAASPEPSGWQMTIVDDGPATGAVGLLAHHADARFGNVTVTPLP